MKQTKPVLAEAFHGTPVGDYRQTLVKNVRIQSGGVPYEGDVVPALEQPEAAVKPSKARTKRG